MAVKSRIDSEVVPPSVTPEIGIELLRKLVEDGNKVLDNRPIKSVDKSLWENKAKNYFLKIFGSSDSNIDAVLNAGSRGSKINQGEDYYENLRFECLKDEIHAANSMIEFLELEIGLNTSCPQCGKRYPKGLHNFCLHCGEPLSELFERKTLIVTTKKAEKTLPSITSALIRVDGSYWEADANGTKTGDPYCTRCWEVDARRIHLVKWEGMQHCPQCASPS